MMKRMSSFFLCIFLVLCLALPVFGAESLVIDQADLLTSSESDLLEKTAQDLQRKYSMDVVIVSVDALEGVSAQVYADDYFDENGYGYGENASGILFLLALTEREWYISTVGDARYAVTDYGVQQLGETAVQYFSDGAYYKGFDAYLNALDGYLKAYQNGKTIDGYADYSGDFYHGNQEERIYYEKDTSPNLVISLLIGILAASIAVVSMRFSMNTRRQQHGASSYLTSGSFHLRTHQDLFLYSNISKTRRQQNSGSSGGGSSVHRSSSGRSHGGGGGKF